MLQQPQQSEEEEEEEEGGGGGDCRPRQHHHRRRQRRRRRWCRHSLNQYSSTNSSMAKAVAAIVFGVGGGLRVGGGIGAVVGSR